MERTSLSFINNYQTRLTSRQDIGFQSGKKDQKRDEGNLIFRLATKQMRQLLILWFIIFTYQKQCELPQVYSNRIHSDLEPFKQGITKQMLDKAKQLKQACIFTILNGKLHKSQGCILQSCFDCQQGVIDLPDMEFVISWLDQPRILKHPCNKSYVHWTDDCYCDKGYVKPAHGFFQNPVFWMPVNELLPLFSSSTINQCFLDILIPSAYHFGEQSVVAPRIPWNKKEFKVFWRGSPTGGINEEQNSFKKYHRHKLIQLCWNISDCDANFGHYLHNKPSHLLTQQVYGQSEHTLLRRQAIYKIIIDIDGHTYSSRFTGLMKMGVAVMKISAFEDIGSFAAKPWEHYIPVDISLKDLEQKIKWAKENDAEVEKISKRGKQLADIMFTQTNYYCYLTTLLNEYHKLLIKGGVIDLKKE